MQSTYSLTVPEIGVGTPLRSLAEIASQKDRVDISGAKGGSLARLLALLAEACERLLVVAESSQDARSMARDLASDLEIFRCSSTPSTIWSPTLYTGSREVMGF